MPELPNQIVNLCREHQAMRDMVEELQRGAITPAAWEKKYQEFSCDKEVEMFVSEVLTSEEKH